MLKVIAQDFIRPEALAEVRPLYEELVRLSQAEAGTAVSPRTRTAGMRWRSMMKNSSCSVGFVWLCQRQP